MCVCVCVCVSVSSATNLRHSDEGNRVFQRPHIFTLLVVLQLVFEDLGRRGGEGRGGEGRGGEGGLRYKSITLLSTSCLGELPL